MLKAFRRLIGVKGLNCPALRCEGYYWESKTLRKIFFPNSKGMSCSDCGVRLSMITQD